MFYAISIQDQKNNFNGEKGLKICARWMGYVSGLKTTISVPELEKNKTKQTKPPLMLL